MQFFGGNAKKEEKKPQQQSTPQTLPDGLTLEQVQQQQALAKFSKCLAEYKEKIDDQYAKFGKQEAYIKGLISKGKRTEAMGQLMTFKIFQDELISSENLVTTLEKAKIQLESALEDARVIEALKTTNGVLRQLDLNNEMENVLWGRKEPEQEQKEIAALMSVLVSGSEEELEEIDELYNKYEQEVLGEQIMDINTTPIEANVNGNTRRVVKPVQQRTGNQQQQVEDSIDDLLQQSVQFL